MRSLAAAICVLILAASTVSAQDSLSADALKDLKAATVFVKVKVAQFEKSGTGFVMQHDKESTLLVTNHHVVAAPTRAMLTNNAALTREQKANLEKAIREITSTKPEVTVIFNSGTKQEQGISAQVLAFDEKADLAILRVRGLSIDPKPVPAIDPEKVTETMSVFVLGFPFGEALSTSKGNPAVTVNKGLVSSIRQDDDGARALIQIDGAINSGNSGGPIVAGNGQLVGVSVAAVTGAGIGFGIPAERLMQLLRGRAEACEVIAKKREKGTGHIEVVVNLIDPLDKIRTISINYIQGVPSQDFLDPTKPAVALPSARTLELEREGSVAKASLQLPADGDSLLMTAQTVYVAEDGQTVLIHPRQFRLDFKAAGKTIASRTGAAAAPVTGGNAAPAGTTSTTATVPADPNDGGEAVAPADRKEFIYFDKDAQGTIRWTADGWIEEKGGVKRTFAEQQRSDEFIEILDRTRNVTLRLYSDRVEMKFGATFRQLYTGNWGATDRRMVWRYKDSKGKECLFRRAAAGWVEETSAGRHDFEEQSRTKDQIELIDRTRNVQVRLSAKVCELKLGEGEWRRSYNGRWDDGTAKDKKPTTPSRTQKGRTKR